MSAAAASPDPVPIRFSESDGDLRLELVPLDAATEDQCPADTLLVHVPRAHVQQCAETQTVVCSFPAAAADGASWAQPVRVRASVRKAGQEYAVEFLLNTTRHELDAREALARDGHEVRLLDGDGSVRWFAPSAATGTASIHLPAALCFPAEA